MSGSPIVRIEIDLNVRVRGRRTYADYEGVQAQRMLSRSRSSNASAPVSAGEKVIAFESESGIMTDATVVDIWEEKQIIYLAVDWHGFRDDPLTVVHIGAGKALCGDMDAPERHSGDPDRWTCTPCLETLEALRQSGFLATASPPPEPPPRA